MISRLLIACFNCYKINREKRKAGRIKEEDVFTFTFLSLMLFILFRIISMLSFRDNVLDRTEYNIDNRYDTIRDEIREEVNSVSNLLFSIKPYKDKFWFNEEQINYMNKKK